jgi:hypothetical protein
MFALQDTPLAANKIKEQAQQLSINAAVVLGLLQKMAHDVPPSTSWPLLRPVLKLFLCLIPEYLPAMAAADTAVPGASALTETDQDVDRDRRDSFAFSFTHSIVMVSCCWVLFYKA